MENPIQWAKAVSAPMTMPSYMSYLKAHKDDRKAKSFIIVRHPFERLVSAFRDKIERLHASSLAQDYYYKMHGREITRKYRAGASQHLGPDFLSKANHYGALVPVTGRLRRVPELPTFWEFVQDVLNTDPEQMNEHWAPIHKFCSLCMVSYDVIVKFENLAQEEVWLRRYLLGSERRLPGREVNRNTNSGGLSSAEITQVYFSVLTDQMVKDLFQIYSKDFELFGYSFNLRNLSFP